MGNQNRSSRTINGGVSGPLALQGVSRHLALAVACAALASCGDLQLTDGVNTLEQAIGPTYTFPIKASSNGRYLVDQNDTPFLLTGFNPQSMGLAMDPADFQA